MKIPVIVLFAVIIVCNAVHLNRRQGECDQVCAEIYSPVCGTDGKTYSNRCKLEVAKCNSPNLEFQHDGECSEKREQDCDDQVCNTQYVPVCGSDGVTYGNSCYFAIAKCKDPSLAIQSSGQCD